MRRRCERDREESEEEGESRSAPAHFPQYKMISHSADAAPQTQE